MYAVFWLFSHFSGVKKGFFVLNIQSNFKIIKILPNAKIKQGINRA